MRFLITATIFLIVKSIFGQNYPDYNRDKLLLEWKSILGASTTSGYSIGSEFSFHKRQNSFAIKFNYNYQGNKYDWRGLEPDTENYSSNDKLTYFGLNYGRNFQFGRLKIKPQLGVGYLRYADEHLGVVHVKECSGWIFTTCNEFDQVDQIFDHYQGLGANLDAEATLYVNEVLGFNTTISLLTSKYQTLLNFSGGIVFCLNPK